MSNDLFSSLGGLVKGLSGYMPQDNPDTKIRTENKPGGKFCGVCDAKLGGI